MIRDGLLRESKGQAEIFPADPQTLYAQEILRNISQILQVRYIIQFKADLTF